jgi:tetratricopeptide (TPR) repeat protein
VRPMHVVRIVVATAGLALVASAQGASGDPLAAAREALAAGQADKAVELLKPLVGDAGAKGAPSKDAREARLLLCEAQIKAGDPDQAVETITPLAEGGDYEVLLATGRAYKAWAESMQRQERSGDDVGFAFDEARSYLEQAAKQASRGQSAAAIELGNLELYTLGEHEAALKRAEKLLDADSGDAEARLLRGQALLWVSIDTAQGGDEEQAKKLRQDAIADLIAAEKALPKTRPEPWAQLAWLYEADGQPDKAVEAAVKALERTPKGSIATLFHLALRYAGERRYDVAALALQTMVKADSRAVTDAIRAEKDPTAAAIALTWAVTPMFEAKAVEPARESLAAIVASKPQSIDPWNNYALICRETQKFEEAFDAYQQALLIAPDSARLNNDAGVVLHYYLHRDYDKAQEYYEKAVELADAALAKTDLDEATRTETQTAKDDAINNLKKLAKGDHTWP